MFHSNPIQLSTALQATARLGLTLLLASTLAACGQYRLTKDETKPAASGEAMMTPEQWLRAWSALHSDQNQDEEAPAPLSRAESADGTQTFASGVVSGAARDRRPTSNQRSGSRLRVRAALTDDGQQAWIGWRDSQRGEDCEFQPDAEGALRCLPSRVTRDVYFSDDKCTDRFASIADPDVEYAVQRAGDQCSAGVRVYSLGNPIEAPGVAFVQNNQGRCVPATLPASAIYRALDDEVPLSEFVAARQGLEGIAARVKAVGLVADDGAISVTGFVDTELKTPCNWEGTHRTVCLPRATEISSFADELCAQPLLQADRNTCEPNVTFGVALQHDDCGAAYYQPGAAYQGNTVYELSEQSYESHEISTAEAGTLQLGVRVSPADLARGELERVSSEITRLSAAHWTTPDGGVWFGEWYDNALETSCSFVQTSDDEWQCLPRDTSGTLLYADGACTQPITEVRGSDGCGEPVTPPNFVSERISDARGGSAVQVRRVLSARPYLATVYQRTESGCQGQAVSTNRRHFDLSQPLPTSSFVRGLPIVL